MDTGDRPDDEVEPWVIDIDDGQGSEPATPDARSASPAGEDDLDMDALQAAVVELGLDDDEAPTSSDDEQPFKPDVTDLPLGENEPTTYEPDSGPMVLGDDEDDLDAALASAAAAAASASGAPEDDDEPAGPVTFGDDEPASAEPSPVELANDDQDLDDALAHLAAMSGDLESGSPSDAGADAHRDTDTYDDLDDLSYSLEDDLGDETFGDTTAGDTPTGRGADTDMGDTTPSGDPVDIAAGMDDVFADDDAPAGPGSAEGFDIGNFTAHGKKKRGLFGR